MKKIPKGPLGSALPAAILALALVGCGETGNGTGGIGGTADQTCRAWCANEPQESSCFQGPVYAVADCYQTCAAVYQDETARQCGEEWIAILACEVELGCNDLFGDCRPLEPAYDDCVARDDARIWCEANCPDFDLAACTKDPSECAAARDCESVCPTQDVAECVQERLTLGTCSTETATSACRQYCATQDLAACVEQWVATSLCEFDTPEGNCQFVCPDVGVTPGYCVDYYEANGVCPDGPPPPVACVSSNSMCQNGTIDPIVPTCSLAAPPAQADACTGSENTVNPTSCTPTGTTDTYQLTVMKVHGDCNGGFDLDNCIGDSCIVGGLAPGEGVAGVDNALAGLAPVLFGVGGNVGGVDQAFHDAMCAGTIDLAFVVDANAGESCATVQILDGGALDDTVRLNLSNTGCVSGVLGTLPLNVAGVAGTLDNTIVRMTVSSSGFSDGLLGGTADHATAAAIADQLIDGGSAVVGQVLDISANLEGDLSQSCNALSLTLDIGGAALP